MQTELFEPEENLCDKNTLKRIALFHKREVIQCPGCYSLFPAPKERWNPQAGRYERNSVYCLECKGSLATAPHSPAECDAGAGVEIFAVDFTGRVRRCERHPLRLEWFLGEESPGTSASVGSGVPIIIRHRATPHSTRYAHWLAEALSRRPGKEFRALYRLVRVEEAK